MRPETDPDVLAPYLVDASNVRGHADRLFRPTDPGGVAAVLAEAQDREIPVTVSAARTSTTGAPVPEGGWILSTECLTGPIAWGPGHASAPAGTHLGVFQRTLERGGWLFPPDPTSRDACTLGGIVATNASGARSFRYGPTRPWLEAVEVVLPTGIRVEARRGDPIPDDWPRVIRAPRGVKEAAGYAPAADLVDVFIGHEGTLGVCTHAWVRTLPLQPVVGFFVFLPDRAAAWELTLTLRAHAQAAPDGPVRPRCLEYLDRGSLDLVRDRGSMPADAGCALFLEQEGDPGTVLDAWAPLLPPDVWVATDPQGHRAQHALRQAVPEAIHHHLTRTGMPKIATDLAVPAEHMPAFFEAYEAAPVPAVLFGHLGDHHLHLNLLPRTTAERDEARAFHFALARRAVEVGGTISAEHGIGRHKRAWFAALTPPDELATMHALKRHLDPRWILNRGVLLSPPPSDQAR